MGHYYYEPAWPNDLLYIFPVVILGTGACIALSVLDPAMIGEPANPLQRRWKFCQSGTYPVFQILRPFPTNFRGLSHGFCTLGLLVIPFIENVNKFQNPFRRPVATTFFLIGTFVTIWLSIGATFP